MTSSRHASLMLAVAAGMTMTFFGPRAHADDDWRATPPTFVPAPTRLPYAAQTVLPTGLRCYALQRGGLPLVAIRLSARRGFWNAAPGLAITHARALKERARALGETDRDSLAGEVDASVFANYSTLGIDCPAEKTADCLRLLTTLVRNPGITAAAVDRAKADALNTLRDRRNNLRSLADDLLRAIVYGEGPGRAEFGSEAVLGALTLADVERQHQLVFNAAHTAVILVGAVPSGACDALPAELKSWAGTRGNASPPASLPAMTSPTVYLIDRPDSNQAQISIGRVVVANDDSLVDTSVALSVQGGSYGSRLMTELRIKRGLTYSVWALNDRTASGSYIRVFSAVTLKDARTAVDVMLQEFSALANDGPRPEELRTAAAMESGNLLRRFETNADAAAALSELFGLGLRADHHARVAKRLAELTAQSAASAGRRNLSPESFQIVVVGPISIIRPQFDSLGRPVVVLSLDGRPLP